MRLPGRDSIPQSFLQVGVSILFNLAMGCKQNWYVWLLDHIFTWKLFAFHLLYFCPLAANGDNQSSSLDSEEAACWGWQGLLSAWVPRWRRGAELPTRLNSPSTLGLLHEQKWILVFSMSPNLGVFLLQHLTLTLADVSSPSHPTDKSYGTLRSFTALTGFWCLSLSIHYYSILIRSFCVRSKIHRAQHGKGMLLNDSSRITRCSFWIKTDHQRITHLGCLDLAPRRIAPWIWALALCHRPTLKNASRQPCEPHCCMSQRMWLRMWFATLCEDPREKFLSDLVPGIVVLLLSNWLVLFLWTLYIV